MREISSEIMADEVFANDGWKSFCEGSMFEHHVPQMEKILSEQFTGDTELFQSQFLQPIFGLLAELKSSCEEYFCTDGECEQEWSLYFEKFVTSVIHIAPLDIKLHKGEFYIHISTTFPGQLILKYSDAGKLNSETLDNKELIRLWSPDWADLMRKEKETRFLFLHCVVRSARGLQKRAWKYILKEGVEEYKNVIKETELNSPGPESPIYKLQFSPGLMLEKPLHILDLNFDVLQSKVAYLSGSRDKRGGPVVVINASSKEIWETPKLTSTELAKICMYYWTIPRKTALDLGCSIVIDWRGFDLGIHILQLIGEAMLFFQESCPGGIHMTYILSTTESPLLMFSASKIKEQLSFEFKLISTVDTLKQYIENNQLTPEFGGTFHYDHDEWIRFRIKLEPYMTGCRSAAKLAMNVIEDLKSTQLGETVRECKNLIEQHEQKVKEVFDDSRLSALILEGEQIILHLQEKNPLIEKTEDYSDSVECVTKLYSQMNDVFNKLDTLSHKRTKQLQECLQLRMFQDDTEKVLQWINDEGLPYIEKHQEVGDSLNHVHNLQQEFGEFEERSKHFGEKIENILEEGRSLSESGHLAEGYGIKEESKTLQNSFNKLSEKVSDRRCQLAQSAELHSMISELSEWGLNSLKHLAWMNMEEITTSEGVEKLKESLDSFLESSSSIWNQEKLDHLSELGELLRSNSLQTQADLAISHYREVQEMLEKRKLALQKAEDKFLKASLASECSSVVTATSDDSNSTSTSSAPGDESDDEDDLDKSLDEAPVARRKYSSPAPEAPVLPDILFTWKEIEEEYVEEEEYVNLPPKVKEKLGYIVSEMVETERDYVKALEYIMENYLQEMENKNLLPSLKGKKNILFGNIERIYDFHKRYFLQDLEKCADRPLHVGNCFIRWERQFFLYALYNKNKPKSDMLLQDHGNAYFRVRQKELGDKLDLASYLIKPVQRMGKYGLLLRDMIKACNMEGIDGRRITELRAAEEMVKFQLRHGNDLLAMDSIKECDVNVKEQGRLLQQSEFTVWHGKKKHERRVFLFEDVVLFSKTKKQAGGADLFIYKNSLKTADIGLTETVGDSGLKFELWFRRRRKASETFVLQARSVEAKNSWVNAITRLLWKQAARNREYGLTEASTGISVGSQPAVLLGNARAQGTGGCEDATPLNTTISFIKASPINNESPAQNRKRLSLISSETTSSMDSSSSSGVYDMNMTHSEEESNLARGRPGTVPVGGGVPAGDDKKLGLLKRSSSLEAQCGTLHRGFPVQLLNENGNGNNDNDNDNEEDDEKKSFFSRKSSLREKRSKSIDDEKANSLGRKKSVQMFFEKAPSETNVEDNSKAKSSKRRSFIERFFSHEECKDKESQPKLVKSYSMTDAALEEDAVLHDSHNVSQSTSDVVSVTKVRTLETVPVKSVEDGNAGNESKSKKGTGAFDTPV